MSSLALSWFTGATPVWLTLCLIAACAGLAWQLRLTVRRIDRHARSIAHMDEWADMVDQSLSRIEDRSRRALPPVTAAPRAAVDFSQWRRK